VLWLALHLHPASLPLPSIAAIAHDAQQFSPQVSLAGGDRDDGQDTVLLEIGGCLRLFHGLDALLSRIDAMLAGHGLDAIDTGRALAHTPEAARLLARAGIDTRALVDDDGRLDLPGIRRALDALPVHALALDPRTEENLVNTGLVRFGELDALPRATLARRFGHAFSHWLDRVTGAAPDLRAPLPPETFFVRELHFLDGIVDRDMLQFPMQRLLGQLGGFLRSRQLATHKLVWRLVLVDGRTRDIPVVTSRPELLPSRLLTLTRVQLESVQLDAPVETLRLACRRFVPLAEREAVLFPELDAERRRNDEFSALFDRLRARLGDARCRVPVLPESAQLPAPLRVHAARRPLWLLRTPQRAIWQDGHLHWHGELQLLDGPERIDGDWWSSRPVRRDYYTARHLPREIDAAGLPHAEAAGALYWVYRDLADDSWHVHGLFG